MPHVAISPTAFLNMVLSSIEVYKKETYGIILGKKSRGNYYLLHAATFQSAMRDYDFVSIDLSREKRINRILKYLTNYRLIGDFHSHADGFEKLSRHDAKEILRMGDGWLAVLIIVKKSSRKSKWGYNARERSLSGPVGDYTVKIFVFANDGGSVEKLPIRCGFTGTINRKLRTHKALERKIEKLNKEAERRLKIARRMQQKKGRI